MARQGISEQQVIEAAGQLAQAGEPVTVAAVREVIGSGSFSTISGFLAKWKEGGGNRSAPDVPDMPETVGRAARAFWGVAWKEAQQEVKGERDALDAVRREMDRDRRDMSAEIARLEAETAHQADTLARLQEELKEQAAARLKAEQAVQDLRVENARLDERAKAAESRGEGLQQELDKLHARLQELAARVTPTTGAAAPEAEEESPAGSKGARERRKPAPQKPDLKPSGE